MRWLDRINTSLGWKLLISYLIVILVGGVTLALVAESAVPTAFNRHLLGMQQMMTGNQMGMHQMATDDLFVNFRTAVTEALLWAAGLAAISAVIVSIFVSRRVVNPIRQMMQASRRIADGHYDERVAETSRDELGQLARSFNQMAGALEQIESMRRQLIGNVAHELRTPLTNIKGYMEGLIDGVVPPDPETYQLVYREADRLQRLVTDLQELSRVEAGVIELNRQPLSIASLIEQTAARLRPQFQEKEVSLRLDLAADRPEILADEDRVGQILLNLVGNALQYTPGGGTVTIMTTLDHDEIQVLIEDTGIGLRAEDIPHLFDRFYRVDKSRSRAGGGSGIGLTIAKHLIEAHGGRIWATSEGLDRGSTFTFTLPYHTKKGDSRGSGR
ncbi:MAG: HAMP domain-containing protein [Anaerolineales bacterium]|nr:HAMP domain-containing protein [Anaerolineales bacterium]